MAVVTAPGDEHDVASRVFVPYLGIDEDPVTGSAHAALVPYWAERLGRNEFTALQASARTGVLHCRLEGDRVDPRRPLPHRDRRPVPAVRCVRGRSRSCCSRPAAGQPQVRARGDPRQSIARMEAAWNRGDFRGYMAGFKNPDVVFVSGGKFQDGWQGTLDHYVRDYGGSAERRGQLHFYNMKVDLLAPDAAMLIGQYRLERGTPGHRGREHPPVPQGPRPVAHHDEPRLRLRRAPAPSASEAR